MEHVGTANTVATVLTLLANAGVLVLAMVALATRVSSRTRRMGAVVMDRLGGKAAPAALAVAVTTTIGSLYYSEVVGYVPCELCWYQRICMYPLAVILLVGLLLRDRRVRWYAAPFVIVGAPLSLYHWLVERVDFFAKSSSCSAEAPCTVPWFQELGYVTLAFMAMSAFLLIGTLLLVDWAAERGAEGLNESPIEPEMSTS